MTTAVQNEELTEKVLNSFLEMVRIDSPSGQEELMCEYLIDRVKALGLDYSVDAAGNLIVEVPKHDCDHDSILVLSGHMDVVPPCNGIQPVVTGEGDERLVSSDNTTVLGADCKAGLAPILEVVALCLRENLPRPHLRLIFTTREEVALMGAKEMGDGPLEANFSLIFDHTGKQGTIIHEAPTYLELTFQFHGKSVHAGIMPEKGVNAIALAMNVVEQMKQGGHLGRIDHETTSNLGTIVGGKATNVVPDLVRMTGELRSHNLETLERELTAIKKILEEEKEKMLGSDYTFSTEESFTLYKIDPDSKPVQMVMKAADAIGLETELIRTNGGSDNNVFVKRGLPGVVLSAAYIDPHTLKERVYVKDMGICARYLLEMVKTFASEPF